MTDTDLDALIAEPNEELFQWNADWGLRACDTLVQLREENALLHGLRADTIIRRWKSAEAECDWYKSRADDLVRYLSMKPPQITAVEAVIAELTLRAARSKP